MNGSKISLNPVKGSNFPVRKNRAFRKGTVSTVGFETCLRQSLYFLFPYLNSVNQYLIGAKDTIRLHVNIDVMTQVRMCKGFATLRFFTAVAAPACRLVLTGSFNRPLGKNDAHLVRFRFYVRALRSVNRRKIHTSFPPICNLIPLKMPNHSGAPSRTHYTTGFRFHSTSFTLSSKSIQRQQQSVQQRLRPGRASRHIDIHRYDLVDRPFQRVCLTKYFP